MLVLHPVKAPCVFDETATSTSWCRRGHFLRGSLLLTSGTVPEGLSHRHRSKLGRNTELRAGELLHLFRRDARGRLAQEQPLRRHLEIREVGDDGVHALAPGERQGALLED